MKRSEGFSFESALISAAVGGVLGVILKNGVRRFFEIQDARLLAGQHSDIKRLVEKSAKLRVRTRAKSIRIF